MYRPFRFVFTVHCPSKEKTEEYSQFWKETSAVIQQEPGSRGTRLHRLNDTTVMAIAEWESQAARDAAFTAIHKKYPTDHPVNQDDEQFGQVTLIGGGEEIEKVFAYGFCAVFHR